MSSAIKLVLYLLFFISIYGCDLHFTAKNLLVKVGPEVHFDNKHRMKVLVHIPDSIKNLKLKEKGCCIYLGRGFSGETDILFKNGDLIYTSFVLTESQYRKLGVEESVKPIFGDKIMAPWAKEAYLSSSIGNGHRKFYAGTNVTFTVNYNEDVCAFRSDIIPIMTNPEGKPINNCTWKGNPKLFRFNHRLSQRYQDAILNGLREVFLKVAIGNATVQNGQSELGNYDLFVKIEIPDEYTKKAFIAGAVGQWKFRPIRTVFHTEFKLSFHDSKGNLLHEFVAHGRGANTGSGAMDAVEILIVKSIRDALNNLSNEIALGASRWVNSTPKQISPNLSEM